MAGTRVTTAPSAAFVVVTVKISPDGAVPSRRVDWKNPDQPEEPLAPGALCGHLGSRDSARFIAVLPSSGR